MKNLMLPLALLLTASVSAADNEHQRPVSLEVEPAPTEFDDEGEIVGLDEAKRSLKAINKHPNVKSIEDALRLFSSCSDCEYEIENLPPIREDLVSRRVVPYYKGVFVNGPYVVVHSDGDEILFVDGLLVDWRPPEEERNLLSAEEAKALVEARERDSSAQLISTEFDPAQNDFISIVELGFSRFRVNHRTRSVVEYDHRDYGHATVRFVVSRPRNTSPGLYNGTRTFTTKSTFYTPVTSTVRRHSLKTTWSYGVGELKEYWSWDNPIATEFDFDGAGPQRAEFISGSNCTATNKQCRQVIHREFLYSGRW